MSSSGSGKKGKGKAPLWFDCSICLRRFTRASLAKHNDQKCGLICPFIEDSALFVNLNKVSKSSPAEITNWTFINTKRYAAGTIFLTDDMILECSLQGFGWAVVTPMTVDSQGELLPLTTSGYVMNVWPLLDPESRYSFQSYIPDSGLAVNIDLFGKMDNIFCMKIEKLGNKPFSFASPIFPCASEAILELDDINQIEGVNFDMEQFRKSFMETMLGRIVTTGNRFQVRYYTDMISFTVRNVQFDSTSPLNVLDISDSLKALKINTPVNEEAITDFFEITTKTDIYLIDKSNDSITIEPKSKPDASLNDIGGLHSVIKELTSTIDFLLSPKPAGGEIPKALLIYGNTGTGKSMLVKTLCSHFSFNMISFEELSSSKKEGQKSITNSITKAFTEAILRAPAAIIIENIDTLVTKKQNSANQSENFNLVHMVRSQIKSLSSSTDKVILLATTSDIDSVDSDLRSYDVFAKEIEIPIPSSPDREDILTKLLRTVKHTLNSDEIKGIASITHGFVGADLKGLCSQSTMRAMQKSLENPKPEGQDIFATLEDFEECVKWVKPSAMRSILVDVPNVRWSDIGGQSDLKFKLKQAIEWPLKHPEAFQRLGIKPPKGILMYGPPGCSKTMIAKAIATESGLNFISVKGSELFSKWVGESEKAVQTLFRKARQVSPSVVFFDEIDSLGGERGSSSGSSNVHERVLAQLLVEIDGIVPLKDVTIVAATNRPDIIDPALLRPGRLDRIVYVPMPDVETREEILKVRFKKMPVDSQVDIKSLAQLTEGYSGAEVTAVCHEAALKALEEDIQSTTILYKHFLGALELVRPRMTKEQISFYENYYKSRKMQ